MAIAATMHAARVEIPWGPEGVLPLDFPAHWPVPEVIWPNLEGAIADYPEGLARTLDAPKESQALEHLVRGGSTVAIIVDDPSRWTPVREALPYVLSRLERAGVKPEDVTICVGVGRHHAVDEPSMIKRVGEAVVARYRCLSPPLDDRAQYVDLGTTPQGVPVRVFRPVAEASLRIMVGSVLPHLQAGFGGGYKLIFPGTSHRSTLGALHRMGLQGGAAGSLLGSQARANPMREAIRAAAALLPGPCFSISHLMGAPGQVLRVVAGDPVCVQDLLAEEAARRFRSPCSDAADVIVVGNFPWPGDPMQSFKVLLQHRAACRKGGVLVGLFWTDPGEVDRSMPRRWLRTIAAAGSFGNFAIRGILPAAEEMLTALRRPGSFMLSWARELVVDRHVLVYAPPLVQEVGRRLGPVRLFDDLSQLWSAAEESLRGRPPARVRVFPTGGLTYQPEIDGSLSEQGPGSEPVVAAHRHASACTGPGGLR